MLNCVVRFAQMNWSTAEEIATQGDGPKARKAPSKKALVNAQTKVRKKIATLTASRGGKIDVQCPTNLSSSDSGAFVGKFANIPQIIIPLNAKYTQCLRFRQ